VLVGKVLCVNDAEIEELKQRREESFQPGFGRKINCGFAIAFPGFSGSFKTGIFFVETERQVKPFGLEIVVNVSDVFFSLSRRDMVQQTPVVDEVEGFIELREVLEDIGDEEAARDTFLLRDFFAIFTAAGEMSIAVTSNPQEAR